MENIVPFLQFLFVRQGTYVCRPLFDLFGLGGFTPSSITHHAFSSDCSVGNVARRSRIDNRFTERFGEEAGG